MGLNWKEFELPGKKLPKWKRTFAVDQETAQVFVAAALTGDEEHLVFICASSDGQKTVTFKNHYFVPASWMMLEFPHTHSLLISLTDALQISAVDSAFSDAE